MKAPLLTIGTIMFVFSFCISLSGCSVAKQSETAADSTSLTNSPSSVPAGTITPTQSGTPLSPTITPAVTPTSIPTISPTPALSEESLSIDAYKSILKDEKSFYSTEDDKNICLKDFLSSGGAGFDTELSLSHFTILDLDADTISEVVLDLSFSGSECSDLYEVLHYMNGIVYGYCLPYRGLEELKSDGTFIFSGGAADWGYATLKFTSDTYEYNKLGYCETNDNGVAFYIDNSPSTEEALNTYSNEQNKKSKTKWYEFTQENVETVLSND